MAVLTWGLSGGGDQVGAGEAVCSPACCLEHLSGISVATKWPDAHMGLQVPRASAPGRPGQSSQS